MQRAHTLAPTAMLTGTIIGAGVFALPALAGQSGLLPAVGLLGLLAGVMTVLHLMLGDIAGVTSEPHRIPGYATVHLGRRIGRISLLTTVLGITGVLLVYLVLLDAFAEGLFGAAPDGRYAVAGWAILSFLVIAGIKAIARTEAFMSLLLVVLIGYIALAAFPRFSSEHASLFGSWASVLAPFGATLFALGGFSAIPEMQQLFGSDVRNFRRGIVFGTLIPAALYGIFVTALVGAFGDTLTGTLTEAVQALGRGPEAALAVLGIVAVATSYLMLGSYVVDTLEHDLRLPRRAAYCILLVPLLLFGAGLRDFLLLVSIVGSIVVATDGAVVLCTWLKLKRSGAHPEMLPFSRRAVVVSGMLFGIGVIMSLIAELT
jgi:amino acid permease